MEEKACVFEISTESRKRKINETKKQKQQKHRYRDNLSDLEHVLTVCNHSGPTYHCKSIVLSDVRAIRSKIFENNVKTEQDTKLCHYISVVPIERYRPTTERRSKMRNFSVYYFLPKSVTKKKNRMNKPGSGPHFPTFGARGDVGASVAREI
ncbi:hypothetical protein ABEB36_015300 [Hypothenemus hampei]|uniref:Uncharacterized protein n=1 Tax=Hypothenemus hampei TaxID=57062 RepID=A0ABD1E0R0_HYPHA